MFLTVDQFLEHFPNIKISRAQFVKEVKINYSKPLTLENVDQQGEEFMRNIDKAVSQCKFCPESYDYKPITFSDRKKPWRKSEPNYDFDN